MAIFRLFCVLVTVWSLSTLPFSALWRIVLRMAKQPKRPDLKNCKVRTSTQPRAPWRVWYTIEENGKPRRLFKSFATENEAWSWAELKDTEVANHGIRYGDIPPEVRRAFDYYRDTSATLRELGASVPTFEELVVEVLTGIRDRLELAEHNRITVADAVELFLGYKRSRVKARQLANLRDHLARFSRDHGDKVMAAITTADVDQWLGSLRSLRNPGNLKERPLLGPLSRNHYRATLRAFWAHGEATARGWVNRNVIADLEPELVPESEPEAYSPEDVQAIMQAALDHKPELLPVLTLGFFCGLRVSEAIELDLSKLTKSATEFRTGGKTGNRIAMFRDTARAWFTAQPSRKGKAWEKSPRTLVDEMSELIELAGVVQIDNGARHSYISYRCAETKDIARVADEVGNSVSVLKKAYRSLVPTELAEPYFNIRPATPAENVVPMTGTPPETPEAAPKTRNKAR